MIEAGSPRIHQAKRERVDPEVQERAAAGVEVPEPVVGVVGHGEREVGVNTADFADGAVVDALDRPEVRGVEAHPHRFHQEAVVGLRGGGHVVDLGDVEGDRLLDEHVFARFEEQDGVVHVTGCRLAT